MHIERRFWGDFLYFYAMFYAKMFHGRDILKHFETFYMTFGDKEFKVL